MQTGEPDKRFDWGAVCALSAMHVCGLIGLIILVVQLALGVSVWSVLKEMLICIMLVYVRMFGITGGYHGYFSHVSYKTSRWFQFILALWGSTAAQWGPLKWAALHRHHHRHSDQPGDIHSVRQQGFLEAHILWVVRKKNAHISYKKIRDFARYWELRALEKLYFIPPLVLGIACYFWGGIDRLFVGFFLSTVLLYHLTYSINSFAHMAGTQEYADQTKDDSRNSFILGILTMGQWHNNHHRYPSSARQGFRWWQIDVTYYLIVLLSWVGLVWDLQDPPEELLAS